MSQPSFKEMLTDLGSHARMFVRCREALLVRVTTILECAGYPFTPGGTGAFYAKHMRDETATERSLVAPVTDEWAQSVVDDALKMMKEIPT